MKTNPLNNLIKLILFLLPILMVTSCRVQTISYNEEKEHFETTGGITYYRGEPYTGVKKVRLDDGLSYSEKHYLDGRLSKKESYKGRKKDGVWESYYQNGQLQKKATYKDGNREGLWEEYYENGQISIKGAFKEDMAYGVWKSYYENGQLLMKASYKENTIGKVNLWVFYSDTYDLRNKRNYRDYDVNVFARSSTIWSISKSPNKERNMDGVWELYYVMGQLVRTENYKDGKKDGVWEAFFDNGQLWKKEVYKEGKRHGVWKYYYKNGQLMEIRPYKNGSVDGIWERYHQNGELWKERTYKDGRRIDY